MRDYRNLYLTHILNFLDLEDINMDNVIDFNVDTYNITTTIDIVFSFKKLKKNNQLDRFYDFYKNMLLDTKGLMRYNFMVEGKSLMIRISLTDK